ncbi:thiamine-phosphate kinase [candidate division KSB1 bacterium]|nr:thiamine-phosphate kinase [candidate division KSB1 bacterium]
MIPFGRHYREQCGKKINIDINYSDPSMIKTHDTISSSGEFELIRRLESIISTSISPEDLVVGLGDDTAVIRQAGTNQGLLITCDIQIEGEHFRLEKLTPYQTGRRAAAVNLSDIAAMGGKPTFALLSLGLDAEMPLQDFDHLVKGIHDQFSQFDTVIIGGNMSKHRSLLIDITLMGTADLNKLLLRKTAQPGDRLYVSGTPGASAAGRIMMQNQKYIDKRWKPLVQKHIQPLPRLKLARHLAAENLASAAIDISDGLVADLYHICEQSNVGARIDQSRLPAFECSREFESLFGQNALETVLYGGEDYELLFTVPSELPDQNLGDVARLTQTPIHEIGSITKTPQIMLYSPEKGNQILTNKGWDHFARRS